MTNPATTACMIGDRYLASAASLASNPFGPVDALDTRSGRAAQVRVLFTGSGWDEEALSGAVSRWCSLGMSEACGVLDFGPHGDGWFLVVPPSLGMPLERWRTVRRPAAVDAARLTLAFGRVLERIASAGFPADGVAMLDLAVGPGPTPFVERPLLGDPGGAGDPDPRSGQRSLAAILTAAHFGELDGPLAGWRDRARAEGFDSLAECLDDLEGSAAAAGSAGPAGALDADLAGLFDEDDLRLESLIPSTNNRRGLQRVLGGAGILAVLAAVLAVGGLLPHGSAAPAPGDPAATQAVPVDPATLVAVDPPAHTTPSKHSPVKPKHRPHRVRHPRVTTHRRATPPSPASSSGGESTPPPTPPPAPPAQPPAPTGGGAATLPDPGGVTTLPPPAP